MQNVIRSSWVGWSNKDICPLCNREGKDIANVWMKGHKRKNGITLETGLSYCEDCAGTPACEKHWEAWYADRWQKAESVCEDNWNKYGVYTNVNGYFGMPSFSSGYVKTPEGLKPYLQIYPDCPRHKLQKSVIHLTYRRGELGSAECLNRITKLVESANVDQEYKDRIISDTNRLFDRLDSRT